MAQASAEGNVVNAGAAQAQDVSYVGHTILVLAGAPAAGRHPGSTSQRPLIQLAAYMTSGKASGS